MLCMQVSYLPNHLSVMQGGSLISYLRGLSILPRSISVAYLFSVSYHIFTLCILNVKTNLYVCPFFARIFFGEQVVKLYERCVIACANYPEYWIRYILCMQASDSMDLANNALARASQVFVKVGNTCICLSQNL